ncbi:MAG: glycine cleavage T C-terminal barrel domain-containing protein, partial [Methanobacteriota archaeon]
VGPATDVPVVMALVAVDVDRGAVTVRVDGEEVPATAVDLPFVDGSAVSARLPTYPELRL